MLKVEIYYCFYIFIRFGSKMQGQNTEETSLDVKVDKNLLKILTQLTHQWPQVPVLKMQIAQ